MVMIGWWLRDFIGFHGGDGGDMDPKPLSTCRWDTSKKGVSTAMRPTRVIVFSASVYIGQHAIVSEVGKPRWCYFVSKNGTHQLPLRSGTPHLRNCQWSLFWVWWDPFWGTIVPKKLPSPGRYHFWTNPLHQQFVSAELLHSRDSAHCASCGTRCSKCTNGYNINTWAKWSKPTISLLGGAYQLVVNSRETPMYI